MLPFSRRSIPFFLCLALAFASGCQANPSPSAQTQTPAPTQELTPTRVPSQAPTPVPPPLGSAENPILMGMVYPGDDPQAADAANTLAQQLSAKTGLLVKAIVGTSYETLLAALHQGKTHIAWLPPLTYLLASERGSASVALMSNHFGVYAYGVQFLANAESRFTPYFDPATNQSTADAAHALVQFAGKHPCWVEPASASGYIVPAGLLAQESIPTLPAVITQDHTAVVRALYIKGICDFGATFAISGDPRTASSIQTELPDVMNKVVVIWQTGPIIPNLNISYDSGMHQAIRQKLTDAFMDISRTQDGQKLLTEATRYEISGLQPATDADYQTLKDLVAASQSDLTLLIGK